MNTHPFARLAAPPYTLVRVTETTRTTEDGRKRANGECRACGHVLRFEYLVRGSDGRCFPVGCDCVKKIAAADRQLVNQVVTAQADVSRAIKAGTWRGTSIPRIIGPSITPLPDVQCAPGARNPWVEFRGPDGRMGNTPVVVASTERMIRIEPTVQGAGKDRMEMDVAVNALLEEPLTVDERVRQGDEDDFERRRRADQAYFARLKARSEGRLSVPPEKEKAR